MPRTEIKKIVQKYIEKLKESNYEFSSVYLFGSHNKGTADSNSDIDIAIISKLGNLDKNRLALWKMRRTVDIRIEPHFFTISDFNDPDNIMAYEIKKTGYKIK
jgi:uncharacterized protein